MLSATKRILRRMRGSDTSPLLMRVVMDILRHAKMATTTDLYAHVMPAAHREVADLIDQAMRPEHLGNEHT